MFEDLKQEVVFDDAKILIFLQFTTYTVLLEVFPVVFDDAKILIFLQFTTAYGTEDGISTLSLMMQRY